MGKAPNVEPDLAPPQIINNDMSPYYPIPIGIEAEQSDSDLCAILQTAAHLYYTETASPSPSLPQLGEILKQLAHYQPIAAKEVENLKHSLVEMKAKTDDSRSGSSTTALWKTIHAQLPGSNHAIWNVIMPTKKTNINLSQILKKGVKQKNSELLTHPPSKLSICLMKEVNTTANTKNNLAKPERLSTIYPKLRTKNEKNKHYGFHLHGFIAHVSIKNQAKQDELTTMAILKIKNHWYGIHQAKVCPLSETDIVDALGHAAILFYHIQKEKLDNTPTRI